MKKKKRIVIIMIFLILLLFSFIVLGVIVSRKNKSDDRSGDRDEIIKIIDKALELNSLLESDKLDSKPSYQNDLGDDCYKYLGDDVLEQIQKIEETYYHFDTSISLFDKATIYGEVGNEIVLLYVCPSKKCKMLTEYNKYFKIENLYDEMLTITLNDENYLVSKKDGNYRLVSELYSCEYEIPESK